MNLTMKLILSTLLVLLPTVVEAQEEDTTKVAFVSYWSVGDSYDFKISKIKEVWKEDELTSENKQEYIANFTVTDSTESSYTITWSYKNDLGNSFQLTDEIQEKLSKYSLTEIKYKTSEVGDFLEILNWQEVSNITKSMFSDLENMLKQSDPQKARLVDRTMKPLMEMYSSKEGIESIVVKELQYFHFPLGVEFDIQEPLIYDEELPNFLGGKPIKGVGKIYFEDIDREEGFCTLKQELVIDPADSKRLLSQAFSKMKLNDKQMKKSIRNAVFEISDRNTYELNMEIIDNKSRRIEKILIELQYNE